MKNITIILVILICLAIIAGAIFIAHITTQPNLEKLLPISTAAYLYVQDIPLFKSSLNETAIYKATRNSKIAELWKNQVEDSYKKVEERIGFDLGSLEPYFTKDAALAVLEVGEKRTETLLAFLANVKDRKKDLVRYIDEVMKPQLLNQGYKIANKNFKGTDYFIIARKQPRFYYAFLGKIFIYSQKEDAILQIINLSKGEGFNLKENKNFQRLKSKLSYKKGFFFYVDIPTILMPYEEKYSVQDKSFLNLYKLIGINSVESFALNTFVDGEGFRTRSFVKVKKEVPGIMQIVMKQKPRKINSPNYIPREFPLVNIGTFNDPSQVWDDYFAQLSTLLPPEKFQAHQMRITSMEKLYKIDLKKDVFNCLGNEMAICTQLIQPEEGAEIRGPLELLEKGSVLILLEVDKAKRLSEFLDRLMAFGVITYKTKQYETEYKSYKIRYLSGGRISPATPGYTFIEDFLLFSSHIETLKKSIDAYQAGKVLANYADYLKSYGEMENKISRVVYVDVRAILKQTPLLTLNIILPEEMGGAENKALQKELLQLGDKLFGSCYVVKVNKDGIIMDSYSPMGPIPLIAGRTLLTSYKGMILELANKKMY